MRQSGDRPIVPQSVTGIVPGMMLISSGELSIEAKLHILQRHDQFRAWRSLDEKRYCLVCGEIITGREIRVIRDDGGTDTRRLACPTENCDAIPMEWVCPTDDVLIKIAMIELERSRLRLIARVGRAIQFQVKLKPGKHYRQKLF